MPRKHDVDKVAINTIRTMTIDPVQKANFGHTAPRRLHTLWQRFLRYDPRQPDWAQP